MAVRFYGEVPLADKTPDNKLLTAEAVMAAPLHHQILFNELLTPDHQVAVLDADSSASLGDCMAAIQSHARPVAARIVQAELG